MIHYKGYIAQVEYNVPAGRFLGRVVNARGNITFATPSRSELEQALADSVDAYLAMFPDQGEPVMLRAS